MDEDTKAWLAAEAIRAEKARSQHYAELEKQAAELRRKQLLSNPVAQKPLDTVTMAKIYDARLTGTPAGPVQTIEGVIADTYGVMTGHLGGGDECDAFVVLSGEYETTWRQMKNPEIEMGVIRSGKVVRIKYVNDNPSLTERDHLDDPVLEIWIES